MSVVSRPPSGKFTVARMVCILFMFCAATVIASPAQTFTNLGSFAGANGANPQSSLVRATDGSFYGTTYAGGSGNSCGNGCGTVFKITPAGTLTSLHSFQGLPLTALRPSQAWCRAPTATSTGPLPRAALSAWARSSK